MSCSLKVLIHNPLSLPFYMTLRKSIFHKTTRKQPFHSDIQMLKCMSMALCKTSVTPLLAHWSYCSLALNHLYAIFGVQHRSEIQWYQHCRGWAKNNIHCKPPTTVCYHFGGLVQETHNSIANALELCFSCTSPSIYGYTAWFKRAAIYNIEKRRCAVRGRVSPYW